MDIIKTYGNLTPLGSVTLINTGWSTSDYMYYQWFLHIESNDPEKKATDIKKTVKDRWAEFQKPQPANEDELLETFMEEGLKTAQGRLFGFMVEKVQQNNIQLWPNIELSESGTYISTVMYLKRKFPETFEWMAKQAQQDKLKTCIQIAKGIEY